ncbi:MAG: type II toxin-antitoxin system HicB family antitoxin [bacterium]
MSNQTYFEYKGYLGAACVSVEDNVLHGKIEFINDLVTFEATTVPELQNEFQNAVDDYLQTCQQAGKEPEKPFKGTFNVRIGSETHRATALAAKRRGETLNDLVKQAVERFLDDERRQVIHHHEHNVKVSSIDNIVPFTTKEEFQWNPISHHRSRA